MNLTAPLPSAPLAAQHPLVRTNHGISRVDEFAWLKAGNWQDVIRDPSLLAADIRDYLEAENAYTAAMMQPTDALQETLFAEMKGRIAEADVSVPQDDGPWEYLSSFCTGGQYPRFARRPRGGDASLDHIYFDGDAESVGVPYFRLGGIEHSPDHARFAYALDTLGSEVFAVRIREFDGTRRYGEVLADTAGRVIWSLDGLDLFYTVLDRNHRPCRVYRHRLGTPQAEDVLVYEEPDPGFFVSLGSTEDRRLVVISSGDHVTSEVRLIDASRAADATTVDRAPAAWDRVPRACAARRTGHSDQCRRCRRLQGGSRAGDLAGADRVARLDPTCPRPAHRRTSLLRW